MDKLKVSTACISMAKDVLEIATHASRDDQEGISRQFEQLVEKTGDLKKLLVADD